MQAEERTTEYTENAEGEKMRFISVYSVCSVVNPSVVPAIHQ